MSKLIRLTKAEEEIMQMIWEQTEPVTVSQLIEQMPAPLPPHSTISSIVRVLEKKGFVDHKAYGRTHVYYPTIPKKEYSLSSLNRLTSEYFEGSVNQLVSFLIKEKNLSIKDLSEIINKLQADDEDPISPLN